MAKVNSIGSFLFYRSLEKEERSNYRINAVLLRGIIASSLIAYLLCHWINLGSCIHFCLRKKLKLCISLESGSTGPESGTSGLRYYRSRAVPFFQRAPLREIWFPPESGSTGPGSGTSGLRNDRSSSGTLFPESAQNEKFGSRESGSTGPVSGTSGSRTNRRASGT